MSNFLRRAQKPQFSMIPDSLWRYHPLSTYARLVYVYLCFRADYADRTAFPSYRTMSRELECSRSQILRAVTELLAVGLLEKSRRYSAKGDFTSNLYTVQDPDTTPPTSGGVSQTPPTCRGGGVSQIPPSVSQTPPLVSHRHHPPLLKKPETPTVQGFPAPVPDPNEIHLNNIKTTTTTPAPAPIPGDPPGAMPAPTPPAVPDVVVASASLKTPENPAMEREELTLPDFLTPFVPLVGVPLTHKWLGLYGAERMREVLHWSQHEAHTNPAGYLRKALEDAWVEPVAIKAQRQHAERQAQIHAHHAAEAAEADRIHAQQAADLNAKHVWWQQLSASEQQQWWQRSVADIAQQVGLPWLAEVFARDRGTIDTPRYGWLSAVYQVAEGGARQSA